MLKHLLLIWIFSGSLDSFSQERSEFTLETKDGSVLIQLPDGSWHRPEPKPDTLRAICLVTLGYRNLNVAHARMGFVVIAEGKEVEYLDCRKKALKLPQVGWGYKLIDPNYKK